MINYLHKSNNVFKDNKNIIFSFSHLLNIFIRVLLPKLVLQIKSIIGLTEFLYQVFFTNMQL